MLASDKNLFYSRKNMNSLFENVNDELEKIFQWFKGNKLPLNKGKTKFFLLPLANLKNNNYKY